MTVENTLSPPILFTRTLPAPAGGASALRRLDRASRGAHGVRMLGFLRLVGTRREAVNEHIEPFEEQFFGIDAVAEREGLFDSIDEKL